MGALPQPFKDFATGFSVSLSGIWVPSTTGQFEFRVSMSPPRNGVPHIETCAIRFALEGEAVLGGRLSKNAPIMQGIVVVDEPETGYQVSGWMACRGSEVEWFGIYDSSLIIEQRVPGGEWGPATFALPADTVTPFSVRPIPRQSGKPPVNWPLWRTVIRTEEDAQNGKDTAVADQESPYVLEFLQREFRGLKNPVVAAKASALVEIAEGGQVTWAIAALDREHPHHRYIMPGDCIVTLQIEGSSLIERKMDNWERYTGKMYWGSHSRGSVLTANAEMPQGIYEVAVIVNGCKMQINDLPFIELYIKTPKDRSLRRLSLNDLAGQK